MANETNEGPYGLSASHEAECRRCGVSCHLAIPVNGLPIVVPGLCCRFLQKKIDGRYYCTVYEERFERAPWCKGVEECLTMGFLAQDCPYAAGRPGYRGKHNVPRAVLDRLLPVLREHVAEVGVPASVAPEAALRFLEADGSRWEAVWNVAEERTRFRPRAAEDRED